MIRTCVFILFVFVTLSAAGCSTLKPPSELDRMWEPPSWEKTTKSKDEVWSSLRDKKIGSSEPLTLVELIDLALENSPSTRQAWEEARAAQTRIRQAESKWYPKATVSTQGTFRKKVTNNSINDLNQADYNVGSKIQFLILDFGGRAALVTKAKQTLLAANFQFNQAFQDLLLDTESFYYEYYSAYSSVEAAESDLADTEATLDAAQQKLQVGLGVKLDVLQAESDYNDALYFLEEAKGELKTAKANLAQVIGFPAETEFEIAPPTGETPSDIEEQDVSRLIEEALKRRPDIAAARATLRAKDAALAAANSDLWPTLNVGGSTDSDEYKYFGSAKNNATESKRDYGYTAYVNVSWNIFDGFYLYSKRNEAKALADAEREQLRQSELAASTDVWTKYYNLKTEISKLKYSKAFLKSADESYNLAFAGYSAGIKSILDLLQSQSQLSNARSKFIQSRKDAFVAFAELGHATGSLNVKPNN
ncbi:TolC family protein [Candidatus Omnitrophota bacterium]